ncbi:MAG: A/G-specific adenine glycosylase [Pseudomonadota bacterium]|jgi:A/G-specific adenine glycosylase
MSDFSQRLIAWQAVHGRHNLPWQVSDPYKVWLSEIMLQQTQVVTVIPYYQQFLERFPDVASLASASSDDVLARWSGLGYYSRARNLHKAAQMVMARFGGEFPRTPELLAELPGVGPSTAAAIAAFSFGAHAAILDGNVKRVLARWAGISGYPGTKLVERELWQLAATLLPDQGIERYTQSLMDMGATVCTPKKPACITCPVFDDCIARQQGRQSELPTPKPKKISPERQTVLMMITRDGKLLLERRPPTGIWGGLWSLPETTSTLEASDTCSQRYGLDVEFDSAAEDFVHVFTHFRLTITPLPGSVIGQTAITHEDHLGWFSPKEALELGLPSPVRKLITP